MGFAPAAGADTGVTRFRANVHFFPNVSVDSGVGAVEQALSYVGGRTYTIADLGPHNFLARSQWGVAASGNEWRVTVAQDGSGIRIYALASSFDRTWVYPVLKPDVYKLLFGRVAYLLKDSPQWPRCHDFLERLDKNHKSLRSIESLCPPLIDNPTPEGVPDDPAYTPRADRMNGLTD